ncbi:MAG: hypothetical protein E7019_04295 [Alphaproteobacteria bacterium]|nr:hypothetical protein [Alphaproteobacteria bacterium]
MSEKVFVIFSREFKSFFQSKLVWFVFCIYTFFMVSSSFMQIKLGLWNDANLSSFFVMQLNLMIMLIPSLSIKLWSEEKKTGTYELTISLPIKYSSLVLGKFLAIWVMSGLVLLSTMGMWFIVAMLLKLNNLIVLQNYFYLWIICGSLCAISMASSVFVVNPISSFVISLAFCLFAVWFNIADIVLLFDSSEITLRASESLNFRVHFQNILAGQISLSSIFYFISLGVVALLFNTVCIGWWRK